MLLRRKVTSQLIEIRSLKTLKLINYRIGLMTFLKTCGQGEVQVSVDVEEMMMTG